MTKRKLRKLASDRRKSLFDDEDAHTAFAHAARDHFLDAIRPGNGLSVSLYWPIADEMNTRPLIYRLQEQGIRCLLPFVEGPDRPLVFREWIAGQPLEKGAFDVYAPEASAPEGVPDILVVPLLAFDGAGYRLGYGGGYYDRTLEKLRAGKGCLAVGYAFSVQEVATVPTDGYDQPLDWIVTEKEARKFA
ncbi:5-formyltetrahydrofolate cyclo-ligase [Sneathiella chinensis]|uniref:5-formyltetrahydrofolate cyclo-ligase n=1 Tax=Sneathiella chinensis TaxID=349750 RepID=UPI00146D9FDA|nr:5-formyltetrahydrofolate cyclo-ligase [Sneathiella chinensis]